MTHENNATENVRVCAHCETAIAEDSEFVEIGGELFCSEDCAVEAGWVRCDHCEEWYRCDEGITTTDYEHFCSSDCVIAEGYDVCECCGAWELRENGVYAEGSFFCSESCAEHECYRRCEHCDEWHYEDDGYWVNDYAWYCSSNCANSDGWYTCENCEEWVHEDDASTVHTRRGEEMWCGYCVDNYAVCCEDCGEWYEESSVEFTDDDGNAHCRDCTNGHDEYTSYLRRYGFTPELVFYGEGKTPYLGVELETDGGRNRGAYCNALHSIENFPSHFYMTEDGSLRNGVEITGHPMTLAYHIGIADMYEKIGECATRYGFMSHNGGRCGLHIHVNRNFFGNSIAVQDAGGYRMMRLLQRFERQFMTFSRRTNTSWCSYRTGDDYTPKKTVVSIIPKEIEPSMLVKSRRMKRETSHSQALNFQHSATFEFRIFRGTLKWSTYFAALALVNGMCHTAKAHGSVWIEDVDWYTFINEVVDRCDEPTAKQYLVDYLDEKGLR